MKHLRFISSLCAVALIFTSLAGCNNSDAVSGNVYDASVESADFEGDVIAENNNYILSFNKTSCGVYLTDKKSGKVFGTNPEDEGGQKVDELGMPIKRHPQLESVISLEYLNVTDNTTSKLISYTSAVQDGRTVCEKCENGLKVSYYFDDAEIMVPLIYTLRDDSLAITLDPTEIQENGNMIISVSLAPYWCALANTSDKGYIMYPSGSGALVYPKEISAQGETYSAEVFGTDLAKEISDKISTEKAIRLPVYGVTDGTAGTLAVIENGADSSIIDMTVGSTSIGYSAVYTTYQLRGYTTNVKELYNNRYYEGNVYSDNMINAPLTIGFYPFVSENADYNDMADIYRRYLDKTEGEKENADSVKLSFSMVGGTMISKSFLGIPYKTLYTSTTVSDVAEILADLKNSGVEADTVNLSGFTVNGIDSNKLGGNFKIDGKLGSAKDLKSLAEDNKNTDFYLDVDTVSFDTSANGFSNYFDAAVRANKKTAKLYKYDIAVLGKLSDGAQSLLARDRIADAVAEAVDKTDKYTGVGIGLSALSNTVYSDYSDKKDPSYYAKAGFSNQVSKALNEIKNRKVLVSDANVYAAVNSNTVINAPTYSSKSRLFDCEIPFYSLALRERTALTCSSINLATDSKTRLLQAVESGMGISYTVIENYSTKLIDSNSKLFYNSRYDSIKSAIVSDYNAVSDYFDKISGVGIARHNILDSGLRETVFENGIRVYVNYSDKPVESVAGEIPAKSFAVSEANV